MLFLTVIALLVGGLGAPAYAAQGTISGVVTRTGTLQSTPLGGVDVLLCDGNGSNCGGEGREVPSDDDTGAYTLTVPAGTGSYNVYFSSDDDFEPEFFDNAATAAAATDLTVGDDVARTGVNGSLASTTSSEIGGTVTTSNGTPINLADITLFTRDQANAGTGQIDYTQSATTRTGTDGSWMIDQVFGEYVVEVRAAAYGTYYFRGTNSLTTSRDAAPEIEVKKGQATLLNASLTAQSTTTISGKVTTGASETPVKDVVISVEYPTTSSTGQTTWTEVQSTKARTDADGTYTAQVPPLEPSGTRAYVVGFTAPGFVTQYHDGKATRAAADPLKPTFADQDARSDIDASLTPATQVTGRITDGSGTGLSGAEVTAIRYTKADPQTGLGSWAPISATAVATSGEDGTYTLTVPGDGKPFRLKVSGDTGREVRYFPNASDPNAAQNLTVAQNQVLSQRNVSLPTLAQLGGSVVNADGTAYAGGGEVQLWRKIDYTELGEQGGPAHSRWVPATDGRGGALSSALNSSGAFSMTLPSGSYRLKFVSGSVSGFLPGLVGLDQAPAITIGEAQVLSLQKYPLPAMAEIRGTVTNLTGAAVSGKGVSAVYRYVDNIVDGAPQLTPWIPVTPVRSTDTGGSYVLPLFARTYRVGVLGAGGAVDVPGSGAGSNDEGYYTTDSVPTRSITDADDVVLGNQDATGIDFRLEVGAPVNIRPPYVTGVAAEGETLTAQPGTWSAADATYQYNWQFSTDGNTWRQASEDSTDSFSVDGRELEINEPCILPFILPLGCSSDYTAYSYRVVVTATRPGSATDTGVKESLATSVAASPMFPGLPASTTTENRQVPQITGKATVGETLTATDGVWSEGGTFAYQWLADGQPLAGATGKTLQVSDGLLGKRLTFRVTETTNDPDRVAVSEATPAVGKGALRNTAPPTITGEALVGKTLTAAPGTWNDPTPTFSYQWVANTQPIPGATTNKLVLTEAENGKAIAVVVTATKPGNGYSPGSATSASTAAVGDDPTKVTNKSQPVISGKAAVGETLTTTDGTWSNQPTSFTYQWLADGTAVSGATASTFVLTKDQRGKKMSVRVTASKTGLTTGTATSQETAEVAGGPLENKTRPSITGQTLEGATLTADPGTWDPSTVTPVYTYQWVADGANIAGATSRTYTLTSAEVGKRVTVKVTASANGFESATAESATVGPIDEPDGEITVTGGPSIEGEEIVGETLRLNPGSVTPGDATLAIQWFRDGQPIGGASGRTYRLVEADEDKLITARVTYTRDGFVDLVKSTVAVGPIGDVPNPAKPKLKTSKKVKGNKLVVKVRVVASSQNPVTGQVELTEGKKLYALKTLNNGKKKLVVKGLKKGFHSVKLTFLGNDLVKKRAKTLNFTVSGRR